MDHRKVILISFVLVKIVSANIYEQCGDNIQCAENNLVKLVDEVDVEKSIPLFEDSVFLEKTKDVVTGRKNEDIFDRMMRFLSSHEVKIKLPETDAREFEGRKRKLRKLLLPLLLVLKLKAAIIVPAVLSLIALVSFKGLGASFVALLIAGATGLKGLLDAANHGPKVSYEVVPHISGHLWNRAGIESYPLAGQGYHTLR